MHRLLASLLFENHFFRPNLHGLTLGLKRGYRVPTVILVLGLGVHVAALTGNLHRHIVGNLICGDGQLVFLEVSITNSSISPS